MLIPGGSVIDATVVGSATGERPVPRWTALLAAVLVLEASEATARLTADSTLDGNGLAGGRWRRRCQRVRTPEMAVSLKASVAPTGDVGYKIGLELTVRGRRRGARGADRVRRSFPGDGHELVQPRPGNRIFLAFPRAEAVQDDGSPGGSIPRTSMFPMRAAEPGSMSMTRRPSGAVGRGVMRAANRPASQ